MIRSTDDYFFQSGAYDSDSSAMRVNRSTSGKRVTPEKGKGLLNRSIPLPPAIAPNQRFDIHSDLDNPKLFNCSSDKHCSKIPVAVDERSTENEVFYNKQAGNYRGFVKSHDPGNSRSMSMSPIATKSNLYGIQDSVIPPLGLSDDYSHDTYSLLPRLSIHDSFVSRSPTLHSVYPSEMFSSNQAIPLLSSNDYDRELYYPSSITTSSDTLLPSSSSNQLTPPSLYSQNTSIPSGDIYTLNMNFAYTVDPHGQFSHQTENEFSKLPMHVFENFETDPIYNTSTVRSFNSTSSYQRSPDSQQFQMGGDPVIMTSTQTPDVHSSKESSDESSERRVEKSPRETKNKKSRKNKKKRENGKQGICNSEDVNIEKVKNGEEKRTAVMLRNLPNRFTKDSLMRVLDNVIPDQYTISNMPLDPKTKRNLGYVFIHFHSSDVLIKAYDELQGKTWPNSESLKTIRFCYAKIQVESSLIEVMN